MRYYNIEVTDAETGEPFRRFTSFPNGRNNPSALNVEIDAPVTSFAEPAGSSGAAIRVWGIPLKEISQATDFNGKAIKVYAGMQRGLPLANPAQAGLIVQGFIFQAFGNWIGTAMTLEFVILPGTGSPKSPRNIVFNWLKGQAMAEAIRNTLTTAFPAYKPPVIKISPKLIRANDEPSYHYSLVEFAQYVKAASTAIIGGDYPGVAIFLREKQFTVFDGTTPETPKKIAFNDLVGQPTWVGFAQVQLTCIMRSDIAMGDYISLPPGQQTLTEQARASLRDSTTFNGLYSVRFIRHVGNFRQPDGCSWVTTIDASPVPREKKAA